MAFNCTVTGTLKQLSGSIGVITPYKSQVMHLKNKLHVLCRNQNLDLRETIEVNTVDAF
jgi:superfamily I DNA and/or RNA helicase